MGTFMMGAFQRMKVGSGSASALAGTRRQDGARCCGRFDGRYVLRPQGRERLFGLLGFLVAALTFGHERSFYRGEIEICRALAPALGEPALTRCGTVPSHGLRGCVNTGRLGPRCSFSEEIAAELACGLRRAVRVASDWRRSYVHVACLVAGDRITPCGVCDASDQQSVRYRTDTAPRATLALHSLLEVFAAMLKAAHQPTISID